MTDKIKKLAVPILLALVILFFGLWIYSESSKSVSFGGLVHNVQEIFSAGIRAGSSAAEVIDSSGNWVGSLSLSSADTATFLGGVTIGSSGTAITARNCTSNSSYNPDSVSTATPYAFDLTPTGYVNGDYLYVSLDTTTQGLAITANASSTANIVSVLLFAPDSNMAAVDLATSTLRVCRIAQ